MRKTRPGSLGPARWERRAADPGAEDAAGPRGPETSGAAVSALAGRPGKVSSQQRSGGNRSPAALEAPRSEELRGWDREGGSGGASGFSAAHQEAGSEILLWMSFFGVF
ncbi:hypothetical protein NN561_019463 [Cricetulus griseus]